MVDLVKGKDARLELLGGFEGSEHWVDDLVVERFTDIEFYDLPRLLSSKDGNQMPYLGVICNIYLLFLNFAVFLSNQHQEVLVVHFPIFLGEFYWPVQVGPVESSFGFITTA